jgi:hypothetical protein
MSPNFGAPWPETKCAERPTVQQVGLGSFILALPEAAT